MIRPTTATMPASTPPTAAHRSAPRRWGRLSCDPSSDRPCRAMVRSRLGLSRSSPAVAGFDGADACVSRSGIGDVSACVRDAISELLEQFADALVALDFDAPDSCSPKPTALPKVVALTTRR